jgi:hypothetical protein
MHPAYFPAAAPSDIFLFGYLMGKMAGFTAKSPKDILSEICRIFQKISTETLMAISEG